MATEFVKTFDPRIDLQSQARGTKFACVIPGKEVTYRTFNSNTPANTATQIINCQPPNPQTLVSRTVLMRATVVFSWPNGTNLVQGRDALRAFPLQSCVSSAQATINTAVVTVNSSQVVNALSRFYSSHDPMFRTYSTAPSLPDSLQTYGQSYGNNSNPLGSRIDCATDSAQGRASFPATYVCPAAGALPTTYTVDICEPVMCLSPFDFLSDDGLGLCGLTSLSFQFNFQNLARMWSHDATLAALPDPTVEFTAFSLQFCYLTAPAIIERPLVVKYPYYNIQVLSQSTTNAQAPGAFTVTGPVVQLNGIPSAIYVWAQKNIASLAKEDTDTYCGIQGMQNFVFGNETGKLAGATSQQLYRIAARNGYGVSYADWSALPQITQYGNPNALPAPIPQQIVQGAGAILKLLPSDFGCGSELLCAGSKQFTQLQMTLNMYCPQNYANGYTLMTVVIYEGDFNVALDGGATIPRVSFVSESDVLSAPIVSSDVARRDATNFGAGKLGGFALGPILAALSAVRTGIKDYGIPAVEAALPVVKKLVGSGRKGRGVVGAGLIEGGSRVMSRDELMKRE